MYNKYIGKIPTGVTAKDLVLELIGRIGAAGGTGCAFEFCGPALKEISMEGIDAGAIDVDVEEANITFYTTYQDFENVKKFIKLFPEFSNLFYKVITQKF